MTKEVLEHCTRAVVRYMNGDMKEFERLTIIAMKINHECVCSNCGNITIPAKRKVDKDKYVKIELCLDCGAQKELQCVS